MCVPWFCVNCVTLKEFGYALVVNGPTTFILRETYRAALTSPRAYGITTVALKGHHYISFSLHYINFDLCEKILCDYVYIIILHVYINILHVYIIILHVYIIKYTCIHNYLYMYTYLSSHVYIISYTNNTYVVFKCFNESPALLLSLTPNCRTCYNSQFGGFAWVGFFLQYLGIE